MFGNTLVRSSQRASSVIIKFDDKRGVSELQLPLGLDAFPQGDYGLKKQLFFKTYQTYRKYIQEKIQAIEIQKQKNSGEVLDQDTVSENNDSYQFKNSQTNESLSYQKLVMFDSILNAYDELKIQSLQKKISRSENIDYTQIHKYLHNAVYLSNGAIYIDTMDIPKHIVKDASTELIEIFCYIYSEIMKELDSELQNPLLLPLANAFKEKRLFEESSLFAEDTYEDTISILKGVLDEIDQATAYKDFDYWHFYDAVYNFLYSNNDGEWTIDNFSYIWERMCLAFAEKYYKEQIRLYDDFGILIDKSKNKSLINSFVVAMNPPVNARRVIRPDLILERTPFELAENFMERIYKIENNKGLIKISKVHETDYKHYSDIEKLKIELFKDKQIVKKHLEGRDGKSPWFIQVSKEEFENFKNKSQELLLNKKTVFDLAVRTPEVIANNINRETNEYLIVDYKYMTEQAFQLPVGDFVKKAITKQYVYELAISLNNENAKVHSEFWIPAFMPSKNYIQNKQFKRYSMHCDNFFKKYKISIIQLDFLELQKNYVENVL
jgi:hypothetical protein